MNVKEINSNIISPGCRAASNRLLKKDLWLLAVKVVLTHYISSCWSTNVAFKINWVSASYADFASSLQAHGVVFYINKENIAMPKRIRYSVGFRAKTN